MKQNQNIEKIKNSINILEKWVEKHDYKGYEPFDGQLSYLRLFTFGNSLLKRILQQTVRGLPLNLRPVLGIGRKESTKGRGYMAFGYMFRWKLTGDDKYKDKAVECLNWLDENKSPYYENHSWGNHFPVTFRGGHEPTLEPIIVWTSIIGQAFLEAYELFGIKRYFEVAKSVRNFIVNDLPVEETEHGACISYVTSMQRSIHNSNMLGSAFLARFARITGDEDALERSKKGMLYSCHRQLPDGSWYYGEADHYHWIDNFHTGYNLDSLKCYIKNTGETKYDTQLKNGLDFFKKNFFEEDEMPKYYHNKTYPIDIQCASQAIETLALFSEIDQECLALSLKVANWTIDNMQHEKKGYFFFRCFKRLKIKTPMLHWGQATMYKALSLLLLRLNNK